jgi:hypothetical protein
MDSRGAGVKLGKKRSRLSEVGASIDKRQRLSDDDSEIIESEESEALPETFGGETKESDSDRRGREQEEREQKKIEEAAERERQRRVDGAASRTKPCLANIGGIRVENNGIITFEGGTDFPFLSRPDAEEATGVSLGAINTNIHSKSKSRGKNGRFKGQHSFQLVIKVTQCILNLVSSESFRGIQKPSVVTI